MKMYNNILVTATNSPYYSSLLTLISNVHKDSLEVVDRIFVFNLGLEENEINYLNTLKNVEVKFPIKRNRITFKIFGTEILHL